MLEAFGVSVIEAPAFRANICRAAEALDADHYGLSLHSEVPNVLRHALDFQSHLFRSDWRLFAAAHAGGVCLDWAFDPLRGSIAMQASQS
mgnify:CR=1 FL=1